MNSWQENIGSNTLVHVIVTVRAKQPRVVPTDGYLRVYVSQAPEHGNATEAARKLLASYLHVTPSCVSLLKGATSRQKIFLISPGL